ncbi:MAG: phosphomethylpyrimidine synthase ThiC [Candidatus Micrarchaeia archaeon]
MTFMLEAKRTLSKEMRELARRERISEERVRREIAKGRIVLFVKNGKPTGIGSLLTTKINTNIGTSPDYGSLADEREKLKTAVECGADTIMDLSTGKNYKEALKQVVEISPVPVGSVPIYWAGLKFYYSKRNIWEMGEDDILNAIAEHVRAGVDFVTVHAALTRKGLEFAKKRVMKIVSRGGCFIASYMEANCEENPLYTNYDYILEILKESNVAISIGDALRPGAVCDASDRAQLHELRMQAELVKRAWKKGVSAICEGPGHMPLQEIEKNVKLQKKLCVGAPYYVLGPLVTDIAPGYDHITSAIGGAIAAYAGAAWLCVVTPSEHLALPNIEDIRLGTVSAKIAAHAADIAKGKDSEWDKKMSKARFALDWGKQFSLSLDREKAIEYRRRRGTSSDACSMCGDFCALKIMRRITKA